VAARHGCVVTHCVPDKPDDVDEQHALLEAAYAERPDALLSAPAHATALNGTLRRMQADGIPILCFVSRPEEIACTCFVGSDDRALARGIADYLFDRLDGGGDVVTLEGHPNAITTAPRAAGFRDAARARESIRSWTRVRAIFCATAGTRG
jgi:ribose transport system substrate-binding protein